HAHQPGLDDGQVSVRERAAARRLLHRSDAALRRHVDGLLHRAAGHLGRRSDDCRLHDFRSEGRVRMRRLCLLALLLIAACSKSGDEVTDTRNPIGTQYVSGGELQVHARPDDNSPVVTKYQHSESVPVMSRKGEWTEVQTAMGTGWVHTNLLGGAEE